MDQHQPLHPRGGRHLAGLARGAVVAPDQVEEAVRHGAVVDQRVGAARELGDRGARAGVRGVDQRGPARRLVEAQREGGAGVVRAHAAHRHAAVLEEQPGLGVGLESVEGERGVVLAAQAEGGEQRLGGPHRLRRRVDVEASAVLPQGVDQVREAVDVVGVVVGEDHPLERARIDALRAQLADHRPGRLDQDRRARRGTDQERGGVAGRGRHVRRRAEDRDPHGGSRRRTFRAGPRFRS